MTKKRRPSRRTTGADERLLLAVGRWLVSAGWVGLVAGPIRVQSFPGDKKGRYELVVPFTGGKQA